MRKVYQWFFIAVLLWTANDVQAQNSYNTEFVYNNELYRYLTTSEHNSATLTAADIDERYDKTHFVQQNGITTNPTSGWINHTKMNARLWLDRIYNWANPPQTTYACNVTYNLQMVNNGPEVTLTWSVNASSGHFDQSKATIYIFRSNHKDANGYLEPIAVVPMTDGSYVDNLQGYISGEEFTYSILAQHEKITTGEYVNHLTNYDLFYSMSPTSAPLTFEAHSINVRNAYAIDHDITLQNEDLVSYGENSLQLKLTDLSENKVILDEIIDVTSHLSSGMDFTIAAVQYVQANTSHNYSFKVFDTVGSLQYEETTSGITTPLAPSALMSVARNEYTIDHDVMLLNENLVVFDLESDILQLVLEDLFENKKIIDETIDVSVQLSSGEDFDLAIAQHVLPNSKHNYSLKVYEYGSGELLLEQTGSATSSTSPAPTLVAGPDTGKNTNRFYVKTQSNAAEVLKVSRQTVSSGDLVEFKDLSIENYEEEQNYWTLDGSYALFRPELPAQGRNWGVGNDYTFVLRFRQHETPDHEAYLINAEKYSHQAMNILITSDNELQLLYGAINNTPVRFHLGKIENNEWQQLVIAFENDPEGSTHSNLFTYLNGELVSTIEDNRNHRANLRIYTVGGNTLGPDNGGNNYDDLSDTFVGDISYFGAVDEYTTASEVKSLDPLRPGSSWAMAYLFQDEFNAEKEQSIAGDETYKYMVTPYYNKSGHLNETNEKILTLSTNDLSLTALVDNAKLSVDLDWNLTTISSDYGTDSVRILRDDKQIARLVGENSYQDKQPIPGYEHIYGIAPIVNGEIAILEFESAEVTANGTVTGFFLDKNGFTIPNVKADAIAKIDGEEMEIELISNEADGSFLASEVYYGEKAEYIFETPATGSIELSLDKASITKQYITYDTLVPKTERIKSNGKHVFTNFRTADELGVNNMNTFLWRTRPGNVWNGETVYTNIYRNEELIDILVNPSHANKEVTVYSDSTGNSGETYAYKLLSYCHGCITAGVTSYSDTIIAVVFPEMMAVNDLTVYQPSPSQASTDLLAHYTFDSNSDNYISGTGQYDGVPSSQVQYANDAERGLVLELNNGYVTLPGITADEKSFTVAAWIKAKPSFESSDKYILSNETFIPQKREFLHFVLRDGQPHMGFYTSDLRATESTLSSEQWYHIAFVYDDIAKTQAIYLDGQLIGEVGNRDYVLNTSDLVIGDIRSETSGVGYIDDLKIWDKALVQSEVLEDFGSEEGVMLEFNYAYEEVDQVAIYRSIKESDEQVVLATIQELSSLGTTYYFQDLTGIPNRGYDYWVSIEKGSNTSQSNIEQIVYPSVSLTSTQSINPSGITYHSYGDLVEIAIDEAVSQTTVFDGFALLADGKIVQTVSVQDYVYDARKYKYYLKHYGETPYGTSITYEYQLYKQNENGIHFFDKKAVNNSGYLGFGTGTGKQPPTYTEESNGSISGVGFYKYDHQMNETDSWSLGGIFDVTDANGEPLEIHGSSNTHIKRDDLGNTGVANFQEIENLEVSKDLSEGVMVTWNYPDFSFAEFVVYRDNVSLDTVDAHVYHYFDKDIDNLMANEKYAYQVRAIYDEDKDKTYEWLSPRATAVGVRHVPVTIRGYVYDMNGKGVAHAGVSIQNFWTTTDVSGYYELEVTLTGMQYDLKLHRFETANKQDNIQSYTINRSSEQTLVEYNINLNTDEFEFVDQNEVATAVGLNATSRPSTHEVVVTWQLSNDNYDGVEVFRTAKVIADIKSYEDPMYADHLGESGLLYTYSVRPYTENFDGTRAYGATASSDATFPRLDPPGYLLAENHEGFTRLVFPDENKHRSAYLILRNDEELAVVEDGSFEYVDKTGAATYNYRYKVHAQQEQGEYVATSEDFIATSSEFPVPVDVIDFTEEIDVVGNSMKLSWQIPADGDISKVKLYKNGKEIFLSEDLATSYEDSTGTPGAATKYQIYTFRTTSDLVSSNGESIETTYPGLEDIDDLIFTNDRDLMQTNVSWSHTAKDIDGFRLTITNDNVTPVESFTEIIEAIPGQTEYNYLFDKGYSGVSYDYDIVAFVEREGTNYETSSYEEDSTYPVLPMPVVTLEAQAMSYQYFTWTYNSTRFKDWLVTVQVNNYISGDLMESYEVVLPVGSRSFLAFEKGNQTKVWNISLKARMWEDHQTDSEIWNPGDLYLLGQVNDERILASNDELNQIKLDFSGFDGAYDVNVYKDGEFLVTIPQAEVGIPYVDEEIVPGMVYLYSAQSTSSPLARVSAAEGVALGSDGEIKGKVIDANGNGVSEIELEIVGEFDDRLIIQSTTTTAAGDFLFDELPYIDEGTTYSLEAMTPGHKYAPKVQETTLSKANNSHNLTIVDQSSVIFSGQISYQWEEAMFPAIRVLLRKKDESGNTEVLAEQISEDGTYSLSALIDSKAEYYQVELDEDYLKQNEEAKYIYSYFDQTKSPEISPSDLKNGNVITHNFQDSLLIPVSFQVATVCGPLKNYRWSLRFQDAGGKIDRTLQTDANGLLEAELPPKNYKVRLVGVDKNSAFTETVLHYFKAQIMEVSLADTLKQYTVDDKVKENVLTDASFADLEYNMTFHKTPVITISNLDGNPDCAANTPGAEFRILAEGETSGPVQVKVEEIYEGGPCLVKTGRVELTNHASTKNQKSMLLYSEPEGWGHYSYVEGDNSQWNWAGYHSFTPDNPNVVYPYTKMVEAHYFNENDQYMASATKQFIVTGDKSIGDSDFFLAPEELETEYPLFVLHDPPGDQSFASISKGTKMSYSFTSSFDQNHQLAAANDFAARIFGVKIFAKNRFGYQGKINYKNEYTLELSFNEDLKTSSSSSFAANRMEYDVGEPADIIVGLGAVDSYSLVRNISNETEQCEIKETLRVSVDVGNVSSTWAYTVGHIKETIEYYESLDGNENLELEGVESDTYLSDRINKWTAVLDWYEENRLPSKLCNYYNEHKGEDYNWSDIQAFCDAKPEPVKGNYYENWTNDNYEKLEKAINAYNKISLSKDYSTVLDDQEFEVPVDSYYKNLTFSGQSSQTLKFSQNYTQTDQDFDGHGIYTYSLGQFGYVSGIAFAKGFGISIKDKASSFKIGGQWGWEHKLNNYFTLGTQNKDTDSFDFSVTLADNDVEDHFNVAVIGDLSTSNYVSSPEVILFGGKSSCPYEPGTIPSDYVTFEFMDEKGNQPPTVMHNLLQEVTQKLPVKLTNLAPYEENRLWNMTWLPEGALAQGWLGSSTIQVGRKGGYAVMNGTEPTYAMLHFKDNFQSYDLANQRLMVAPACQIEELSVLPYKDLKEMEDPASDNYYGDVFEVREFSAFYKKPVSPVAITRAEDGWISLSDPTRTLFLSGYRTDQKFTSLDKIWVEARRSNESEEQWQVVSGMGIGKSMTDSIVSELDQEYLDWYYHEMYPTWEDWKFPYVYDHGGLLDGSWKFRAVAASETGELAFSNVVGMTIDRKPPRVVGIPAPSDSILSRGEVPAITFDEAIDIYYAIEQLSSSVKVKVIDLEKDSGGNFVYDGQGNIQTIEQTLGILDYSFKVTNNGITVVIEQDVYEQYDGRDFVITIPSAAIRDVMGNHLESDATWRFVADTYKRPVSPIRLNAPTYGLINLDNYANRENGGMKMPFIFEGVTLYEFNYALDSVILQYRNKLTNEWFTADKLTYDEMVERFERNQLATEKYQDTLVLDWATAINSANDVEDYWGITASYLVRFQAFGDGRVVNSNAITADVDLIAPYMVSTRPVNYVIANGGDIFIRMSERLYDHDLPLHEILLNPTKAADGINWEGGTDVSDAFVGALGTAYVSYRIDFDKLIHYGAHFGDTLTLYIKNLQDQNGNILIEEDQRLVFTIGNIRSGVSTVRIDNPKEGVINASTQQLDFEVADYDLYDTKYGRLDELVLAYRKPYSNEMVGIDTLTWETLDKIHRGTFNNGGNDHNVPTAIMTWNTSGSSELVDGTYKVYAITRASIDGEWMDYYSSPVTVKVDLTPPGYTGIYSPSDGLVEASDYFIEFKFNESIALGDSTKIILKNEATDGTRSVIDASLYDVVASSSNLQVWPSQSLRAFYTVQDPQSVYYNAKLMVEVRALVDEVGNELEVEYQSGTLNNFAEFFIMDPNYSPPAGSRQLTDIAAERIETGEVAVNWTSYESYDETMLERSRDGLNFTEIARYNGNIDSHMDEVNFSKVVFYRLKQTVDTTAYYSKTVAVETDNLIPLLVTYTYPMPFDGREFRLSVLTNNLEEDLRIQVMNTTGRVIANQSISAETLNNLNLKISFDEPLKPGIYHMQMVQGEKRSYQKLLVAN